MNNVIGYKGGTQIKLDCLYAFRIKDGGFKFGFVILDEDNMAYGFEMADDLFPMIMISKTVYANLICKMETIDDDCRHFGELKKIWKDIKEESCE